MHIYVIACGEYRKVGSAANVDSRKRAMAIGCPHPLVIEFTAPCPIPEVSRAEYGAHWLLALKWHFGEWFSATREEAVDAVEKAIAWAISGDDHCYNLLGPEPEDRAELGERLINARAREQAYMTQPNRKSGKRQQAATLASRLVRAKRKAARLDKIRDRWHDRAYDTEELLKEAGLSRRTVYNELKARFPDERIEHA